MEKRTKVVSGFSQAAQRTNFLINPSRMSCSFAASCSPLTIKRPFFMSKFVWAPNSQPKYFVGSTTPKLQNNWQKHAQTIINKLKQRAGHHCKPSTPRKLMKFKTENKRDQNLWENYLNIHVGGRSRALAISAMFAITVLIPFPLPSTLASRRGIL